MNKGLITLIVGGSALVAAGYSATTSAAKLAVIPMKNIPIEVIRDITIVPGIQPIAPDIKPMPKPNRPPARSLYRPGPRNPGNVLE